MGSLWGATCTSWRRCTCPCPTQFSPRHLCQGLATALDSSIDSCRSQGCTHNLCRTQLCDESSTGSHFRCNRFSVSNSYPLRGAMWRAFLFETIYVSTRSYCPNRRSPPHINFSLSFSSSTRSAGTPRNHPSLHLSISYWWTFDLESQAVNPCQRTWPLCNHRL